MDGEKSSRNGESAMSSVASEASNLLRAIVSPPRPGESIKAMIGRSARKAGLSFIRAKKLWYQEAARIDCEEMDRLRGAVAEHLRGQECELRFRYEVLTREIEFLRERLAQERAERNR